MAIDRTAYNALQDETGSGNGSIWDKNAIKTVLLDPIDTALLTSGGTYTVISNTDTGTQNNWAPAGLSGNTFIKWNGASDITVTGLAGGAAGQNVIIKNVSATATRLATFNHAGGGSSAANRFTNCAVSGATPVGQAGFVWYQHDGTDWKLIHHDQGAWITPAYAAGDFTASASMTWTVDSGDVLAYRYWLKGRTLVVAWVISGSSVGGTPHVELRIKVPGGFTTAAGQYTAGMMYKDNGGTWTFAASWTNASATVIGLYTAGFGTANWTASTNATGSYGEVTLEVT